MEYPHFPHSEKTLRLYEELLAVEEDRLHGQSGNSIDDVVSMMKEAISKV